MHTQSKVMQILWFVLGEVSPDLLRTKKSELRLYCDLLMQQVHSVKSSIQEEQDLQVIYLFYMLITCCSFISMKSRGVTIHRSTDASQYILLRSVKSIHVP